MSTDCGIPGYPTRRLLAPSTCSRVCRDATGGALKLATSRAAELLDLPDRGVIAEGKRADLLVVEGTRCRTAGAAARAAGGEGREIVFRR
jgi:imidazolonepropionase-like amidohydrolase